MTTALIAGIITLIFTTMLTVAGEGAAIILIPTFIALDIDLQVAKGTALLLNSFAMILASARYVRHKLIMFKVALPMLIVASIFSPLGCLRKQLYGASAPALAVCGLPAVCLWHVVFLPARGEGAAGSRRCQEQTDHLRLLYRCFCRFYGRFVGGGWWQLYPSGTDLPGIQSQKCIGYHRVHRYIFVILRLFRLRLTGKYRRYAFDLHGDRVGDWSGSRLVADDKKIETQTGKTGNRHGYYWELL